ncbi:MAG: hypothetical protein K2M75_07615 [Clostridia bacterium]|nr:hypothetical protein [Clostridia bacterium]
MFYQEVPYVNYVQQDSELAKQGVELILSQNTQIDSFSVLILGNRLLVGVLPHPLYSRSQRDALKQSIIADINEVYGFEEILVSFDMDVLYEINKFNKSNVVKDDDISKLFYSVKVRRG